jgi:hypothetical protein
VPALGVAAAIALYGFNGIDLLRMLILWLAHIPLGWVYVHFAIRRLPKVVKAAPTPRTNPFADRPATPSNHGSPAAPRKPSNPFAASTAETAPAGEASPLPEPEPRVSPDPSPDKASPHDRRSAQKKAPPAAVAPATPKPEPPPDDILNPS